MSVFREIRDGLKGAVRLFLFDAAGVELFNATRAGLWRSFLAALVALPWAAVTVVMADRLARATADAATVLPAPRLSLSAEAIAYPLRWALFPLAMIGLVRLLKITDRYVPYVVAYNWANVIASIIMTIPFTLYGTGLLDASITAAALPALELVTIVYLWFIARTSLRVPVLTAIGLVAIDVLLSLIVDGVIDRVTGA